MQQNNSEISMVGYGAAYRDPGDLGGDLRSADNQPIFCISKVGIGDGIPWQFRAELWLRPSDQVTSMHVLCQQSCNQVPADLTVHGCHTKLAVFHYMCQTRCYCVGDFRNIWLDFCPDVYYEIGLFSWNEEKFIWNVCFSCTWSRERLFLSSNVLLF